jgi:hypothetical protein
MSEPLYCVDARVGVVPSVVYKMDEDAVPSVMPTVCVVE